MKTTSGFPSWPQFGAGVQNPSHLTPRQEASWETVYRPLARGKVAATDLFVSWKTREQFRENAVRFLISGKKGYDGYLVCLKSEGKSEQPTALYKTGHLGDLPCITSGPEISITPLFETRNDVKRDSGITALTYQITEDRERLTLTANSGVRREYTHFRRSSQEPLLFSEVNQFALRHVQTMRTAENPKPHILLRLIQTGKANKDDILRLPWLPKE